MILHAYRKFVPRYVKEKISIFFNPTYTLSIKPAERVQNYFNALKNEIKFKNNSNFKKIYIHEVFKQYKVRSNFIDDKWWSDFILLLSIRGSPEFDKCNESLINRIEKSNFNSLEYFEVLHIYSLALRIGLFELGYHLRKQSIKIALNYSTSLKKNKSWKIKAKLSALLESRDFDEFDKLFLEFEKISPLFKTRWRSEKYLLIYLRKIFGNRNKTFDKNSFTQMDVNDDFKFRNFLENKKVVIVGPAPNSTVNKNFVDNFDIVIKTNYYSKDQNSLNNFEFLVTRCDITYVNGEVGRHIINKSNLNWPKDISWIVGKIRGHAVKILKKLSMDKINDNHIAGRDLEQVEPALFNGFLNALPNILIDLSRYNPKEIFLCNFDLMLTKERYHNYYQDHFKNIGKIESLKNTRLEGFAVHDPVTQLNIMKNFWKNGIIKGDDRFEKVIKMKTLDYMKTLQKNYLN